MPHTILILLLVAMSLLPACGGSPAPGGPEAAPADPPSVPGKVNVYNWGDYIAPAVIEEFEAATGIRVNYDLFDSQEMLETKLLAGSSSTTTTSKPASHDRFPKVFDVVLCYEIHRRLIKYW